MSCGIYRWRSSPSTIGTRRGLYPIPPQPQLVGIRLEDHLNQPPRPLFHLFLVYRLYILFTLRSRGTLLTPPDNRSSPSDRVDPFEPSMRPIRAPNQSSGVDPEDLEEHVLES